MGVETIYVVSSMVLLTVVTLGVAHYRLGVPSTPCVAAVFPTILVGSVSVAWLRTVLDLHIFAVPAGVGVVVLLLEAVATVTR